MDDIFDNGAPKYQSPQDIFDALQNMATGEEIGILSEMFGDVSWENQDYYYTDNGSKLVERWEEMTDNGNNMWLMDVAAWQLGDDDANDWIYQILCNDDLAKRIGFKKLFIDTVLDGMSDYYKSVVDAFMEELQELDRFDYCDNMDALITAMTSAAWPYTVNRYRNPYSKFVSTVYDKLKGLRLDAEKQLVAESRAMLTAYDDFLYGLKANQYLYNQQETAYQTRLAELKANYTRALRAIVDAATAQGVVLDLPEAKAMIEAAKEEQQQKEEQ